MVGRPSPIFMRTAIIILLFSTNFVFTSSNIQASNNSTNVNDKFDADVTYTIFSSLPLGSSNTAVHYFIPGSNGEILLTLSLFSGSISSYKLILYSTDWNSPLLTDDSTDDGKVEISHIINTSDPNQESNALWRILVQRTGSISDSPESWSVDVTYK